MRKIICLTLFLIMINTSAAVNATAADDCAGTAEYLVETVSDPTISSIGGEWTIIGLSRSDIDIDDEYFKRGMESVLAQTFTDFELLLVDDGSPDNCGKICDEYAKKDRRIFVIHQENGGLSAARNTGINWFYEQNRSDYITFVDSDDWVVSNMYSVLLDVIKKTNCEDKI